MRVALREVPQPALDIGLWPVRHLEHVIEAAEANQRQHFVERLAGQLCVVLPGAHRDRALAVIRRRIQQHVQIVLGVDREALAHRGLLIRMPRREIGAHRIAPAAHFVPGMRWHVVDVTGAGDRLAQELGARFGAARHGRGLGGVHVEVTGAWMADVPRQDALQHLMQPMDVRIVYIARAAPRLEQKEGVGIQRGDLEVLGILRGHLLHGVSVGAILLDAPGRVERLEIAHRDRVDQRTLRGRGATLQRQRFLCRCIRVRRLVGIHGRVEVRPPRPRFAPVTDRAPGIALPGFAERSHRLPLREGVHHLEALVEVRLRLGVGRVTSAC